MIFWLNSQKERGRSERNKKKELKIQTGLFYSSPLLYIFFYLFVYLKKYK